MTIGLIELRRQAVKHLENFPAEYVPPMKIGAQTLIELVEYIAELERKIKAIQKYAPDMTAGGRPESTSESIKRMRGAGGSGCAD